MELSAIGEQVFAVESVVKKRVRKVTHLTLPPFEGRTFLGEEKMLKEA